MKQAVGNAEVTMADDKGACKVWVSQALPALLYFFIEMYKAVSGWRRCPDVAPARWR